MLKIAYCDDVEKDRDNIVFALTQIEVEPKGVRHC